MTARAKRTAIGFKAVAAAGAVTLVASFYLSGNADAGTAPRDRPVQSAAVTALADSSRLTTPVLAKGRLVSSSRRALPGATVVLAVWPSNEALASMRVGQTVTSRYLARAVTDRQGRWVLRLPSNVDLSGSVSRYGDVNFQVLALTPGQVGVVAFSSHAVAATATRSAHTAARAVVKGQPVALPVTGGSMNLTINEHQAATQAGPDNAPASPSCANTKLATNDDRTTIVAEVFSDAASVTATFTYTAGQSSSLGVAVSAGNASLADIAAGFCVPELRGDHWEQRTTAASTNTSGVSMSSLLNINLSSQTGYSNSAMLNIYVNGTGHPLCGFHAKPGTGAPGLLQVHSSVVQ